LGYVIAATLLGQASTGGGRALSLVVLISVVYLLVLRFVDLNEKEPLWALGLFFSLGGLAGLLVHLVVSSRVIVLETFYGPVTLEVTRFAAFLMGLGVLVIVERWQGWFELDGVMDGIVYGAAVGLGVATGGIFVQTIVFDTEFFSRVGPFTELWSTALVGLSAALFGGIIGAGFGYGRRLRGKGSGGLLYGLAGLIAAVGTHVLYRLMTEPGIGSGSVGLARRWFGLLLPLALILAAAVAALRRERRAIATQLDVEVEAGVISADDLENLQSFLARRRLYLSLLLSGKLDRWQLERSVHNRQVRLAILKANLASTTRPDTRAELEADIARVRASILALKGAVLTGDPGEPRLAHD
jgi:protease PrsW